MNILYQLITLTLVTFLYFPKNFTQNLYNILRACLRSIKYSETQLNEVQIYLCSLRHGLRLHLCFMSGSLFLCVPYPTANHYILLDPP